MFVRAQRMPYNWAVSATPISSTHPLVEHALAALLFRGDSRPLQELGAGEHDRLFELAEKHRVLPPLCAALCQPHHRNGIAAELSARAERLARGHACTTLAVIAEVKRVCEVLAANEIPCALFKGFACAALLHGGAHLRHLGDIDLMIPDNRLASAAERLIACGYHPASRLTRRSREAQLVNGEKNIALDLHTAVLERRFRVAWDSKEILSRRQQIRAAPTNVYVPAVCPEDEVLIECLHGLKHMWCKLLWLLDLARALQLKGEIDFEALVLRAGKLRVERALLLGFELARRLTAAELPPALCVLSGQNFDLEQLADELLGLTFTPRSGLRAKLQNVSFQTTILSSHLTRRRLLAARGKDYCGRVLAAFGHATPFVEKRPGRRRDTW